MERNPFYTRDWVLKRYYKGPLLPHLHPFAIFLEQRGYPYGTGQRFVREVGRLSAWLCCQGLNTENLNEDVINAYIGFRGRGLHSRIKRGPYLRLLEYLRQCEEIDVPATLMSPLESPLDQYRDYLLQNRGLAKETMRRQVRVARDFLASRRVEKTVEFSGLKADDIVHYLLDRSRRCSPTTIGGEASALRSFLRFLQFRGDITPALVDSVPTVPRWRNKSIPSFLREEEISLLLQQCNSENPKGQRDIAILLFLARLGLRAVEICRLTLDDIDWHTGYIVVRGKNGSRARLPLLNDIGQALSKYLLHGRPNCPTRHVFVRSVAPFEALSSSSAIAHVVRQALSNARLNPPRKGSHLLRHSLATQMLQRGASLEEIGQILRHQNVETTSIYAKVALDRLRPFARSWPQGGTS